MVHKNTKKATMEAIKLRVLKAKELVVKGVKAKTKNFSKRKYLSRLYSRTSGLKKEFI